jgi:hypothetical protein
MVGLAALAMGGCAADDVDSGDDVGEAEGEIGASPKSAGITAGSADEEGVLLLVNDRSVTESTLKTRTKLTSAVAKSIVAFRTTADGKPRWFSTIDEIDALPSTGKAVFQSLIADAKTSGYTEAPGFDAPLQARIVVPPNLGRPPTSADVSIEAGFDGKSPDEVAVIVRGRLTNTVDNTNESFVKRTIAENHKTFTLAANNFFVGTSPHAIFARALGADRLTLVGTMSSVNPTILVAEKAGVTQYYTRGASGRYESIPTPKYPVIMRARIRVQTFLPNDPGPGIRITYPAWSAKVLTGPTTTIIEGNH